MRPETQVDLDQKLTQLPIAAVTMIKPICYFRCGAIDFGSDSSVNDKLKNVKMQISTKDKMFENIRFKHFSTIFTFLSENAKQLQVQQAKAKVEMKVAKSFKASFLFLPRASKIAGNERDGDEAVRAARPPGPSKPVQGHRHPHRGERGHSGGKSTCASAAYLKFTNQLY